MSSKLDLLIFGATGFTGKYAVLEMVKISKEFNFNWGIAGRNLEKLKSVLQWTADKLENISVRDIPTIVADVKDTESLTQMAKQTKVLINCCGPYRHFGYPVVEACVNNGAHYVDVSGEPFFMEQIQADFHERAKEANVYVVSACGFDSIPADLGIVHLSQIFDGTICSVEAYLSSKSKKPPTQKEGAIHYATWESAVYGLAYADQLKPLRRKLYGSQQIPKYTHRLKPRSLLHKNLDGLWCLPFPGADRSVVYRTQRHQYFENNQRPIAMNAYIGFSNWFQASIVIILGAVFTLLCRFNFGRKLLLRHPKFFSNGFITHEGPSEDYMDNTEFFMKFIAEGWSKQDVSNSNEDITIPPTKQVIAEISGTNPGYGFTVKALLLSGITLLSSDPGSLPNKGGVYTPGAAFQKTNLMKELLNHGMKFKIISDEIIPEQNK